MVTKVIMPKFGLSMETGVLGSWLVGEGASVTKGSALAEITTDKITNTCEAPKDGILRKILLPEGEEAACGEAIAVLADTADEDISAECGGSQSEGGAFADSAEQAAAASPVPEKAAPADIKITPRAKKVAEEQGLELVKISPQATPPVCKLMNYGKYKFEQSKREKEARKNQHVVEIKEIRMSPGIDVGDFNTKLKNAQKFLSDGNRVKVSVRFRGREMAHTEIGRDLLNKFAELCTEVSTLDKAAKLEGRNMSIFLSPKAGK